MILNTKKECVSDFKPFLLLIQKTNIFGVSLDKKINGTPEIAGLVPVSGLSNAYDADFDSSTNQLFHLEHATNARLIATTLIFESRVYRTDLNRNNRTQLLQTQILNDPYCMAYDFNGRNLYIGNKISQNIEVVRTQGTQYRATILSNDQSPTAVAQPVAIAIDSDRGLIFWLDQGAGANAKKVARADLDGKNALIVVNSDLSELDSIALDTGSQRIYFTEAKSGHITSVAYDGQFRVSFKNLSKLFFKYF